MACTTAARLPADAYVHVLGTVDPRASLAARRAYLAAFFARHLRHRVNGLLDGPAPDHPVIRFVR